MQELSVTRLIAASPETVYRVWTTRTSEWFAPLPWKAPVVEQDFRAGGRSYVEMEGPDGTRMPGDGVILEVVPNEKIVFTDAFKVGWEPQEAFMVAIVTFEPEAGGTRYTARVRHWSEEALKRHQEMGFETGWGQVTAQLAELAEAEEEAAAV
jgi:uncharacterized protein YndB with AHSA1/START domain